MAPTLNDGDYVLSIFTGRPKPGRVYIINHGDLGRIVKRLSAISPDNHLSFTGDNPASTPDALLRAVEPKRLLGRAWVAITKNGIKRIT